MRDFLTPRTQPNAITRFLGVVAGSSLFAINVNKRTIKFEVTGCYIHMLQISPARERDDVCMYCAFVNQKVIDN